MYLTANQQGFKVDILDLQSSHEKKGLSDTKFIESWLFNQSYLLRFGFLRSSHTSNPNVFGSLGIGIHIIMVYEIITIYNWVVFHPRKKPNKQIHVFHCSPEKWVVGG